MVHWVALKLFNRRAINRDQFHCVALQSHVVEGENGHTGDGGKQNWP
jgi:hypothetical protein